MFQVEQTYDFETLTALCRAARKTVRRRRMRILRGVCWLIFAAGAALCVLLLATGGAPDFWMIAVFAALLLLLLFEDKLDAWVAKRQMLPGTAHSVTVFDEEEYTVTTDVSQTCLRYENVMSLCETERYFIFFLSRRHGQCFDKQGLQGGEPNAFRVFIEQKTGKTFQRLHG